MSSLSARNQSALLEIEPPSSRRRFITGAIAGLTGAMALMLSVPAAVYLFKPKPKRKDSEWMDAGEINTNDNETPREITFRHNRIDGWKVHSEIETAWLSKDSSGKLLAFSPWCTHLGCAYRWEAARSEFSCPCHGSRFGKEGQVLAGPASRPLDRYQIKMEGKRVWLAPAETPKAV